MSWQTTYVAVSSLLEESVEDSLAALSDADRAAANVLAAQLTQSNPAGRAARAKALATELAKIAQAVEAAELAVANPSGVAAS